MPVSMLKAGSPEEVDAYVKDLMDNVAQDGEFILSSGGVVDQAEPENLHALIKAGKKYGVYR